MADTLPSAQDCCLDCPDPIVTAIPGPAGPACTPCDDGAPGVNAYSLIDGSVVVAVPAYGMAATITLLDPPGNRWMGVDQTVFISPYGYFQVTALIGTTQATVLNLGDGTLYPANINNGVNFAGNSKVSPGGVTGPQGNAGASGAPVGATYITQIPDGTLTNEQPLSVLATGLMFSTTGTGVVTIKTVGIAASNIAPVDVGAALTAGQVVQAVAGGLKTDTAANTRTLLGLGTIATQNANAVSITGGVISGTPISGSTGSFTTLVVNTNWALAPSALQTLAAANLIVYAPKVRVAGNAAPVTMTSTPTLSSGTVDGQECLIQGTDDTNTVTIQDDGTLAGSKLRLGATSRVLGKGDSVRLTWDTTAALWFETSYTNLI